MSQTALLKRVALIWGVLLIALNYVAYFRVHNEDPASKMLDLRGFGYSPDDVRNFAAALTLDGRMDYRDIYFPLDLVFIAFTLAVIVMSARIVSPRLLWAMVALAGLFVAADITENLHVRKFVLNRSISSCFVGCDAEFLRAAWATRIKFASLSLGAIVLGISFWRGRIR